jgi:site-specific DNA-methyltransferase (adenine-specific)
MKPYYQHGGVTIWHGDCREILPRLDAVALCVTDPPYNVGINYGEATNDRRTDYEAWCASWFKQVRAKSTATAIASGTVNVAMWCRIQEPDWIIGWHKPAAMGRSPVGFNNWEPVLFYGKAKANRGTDVVTAGILPDAAVQGHPCPKPERWAIGLVSLLSDASETVLDPFMGSGTTLVAAKRLCRKAIGIEVEERFCEMAANRLAQEVLPLEVA